MTGRQIANNLRKSKRKWGKRAFYSPTTQAYCVLGIKAVEKGITVPVLKWCEDRDTISYEDFPKLDELVSLNDTSSFKGELIDRLEEEPFRTMEFDVEGFVRHLKDVQKKRLHRKKRKEEL